MGVRPRSRAETLRDSQHRAQIIITAGLILVALIVIGIGAFGYYQTSVHPKQQAVVRVGDRTFSMAYVERRLRYTIRSAGPSDPVTLNQQSAVIVTLNAIESEELNRIGAPQLGISVSSDEVDTKIRQSLALPDSVDQTTFAQAYRQEVKSSGLNPDEYREVIGAQILEDKIRQNIRAGIPDTADQVRVRDIRVVSQGDAQKILDRLAAGEDFATVASTDSQDLTTKSKGGEMDWQPRGTFDPTTGDAVFALEVGQVSQPLFNATTNSYYIFQMLEKASAQPVTDTQRTSIENQSYIDWQTQMFKQVQPVRYWLNDNQVMLNHLVTVAKSEGSGVAPAQP